jgi:hypothetical protein
MVMKGAIPPEAKEDRIAGRTRTKKWRRGTRENKSRIEGVSGRVGVGGGGCVIAVVLISSDASEERGDTLSS